MLRVFLLCCIALFLNGCIQIGNYSIPLEPVYSSGSQKKQHTQQGKSRFSEEDLNSYRKSGSYYKTINTQRNSHLPKGKPLPPSVLKKSASIHGMVRGFTAKKLPTGKRSIRIP